MPVVPAVKTGIVGAGAMGSLTAYLLQKAGIDFVVLENDKSTVELLKSGLTVLDGDDKTTFSVKIGSDPAILHDCEIIFLFVKSYSTEKTIASISTCLNDRSTVITLQNGLGNAEIIAGHIAPERLVYGTTTYGATKTGPSEVVFGGEGEIIIGGRDISAVDRVHLFLKMAGLHASVTPDPDRAIWEKTIINASINPIGALLNVPNGTIADSPELIILQEKIVREASSVAVAMGIEADADSLAARARDICVRTANNLCSMLQDIRNRRRTEIDSINGAIVRYGIAKGIPVPVNETLRLLVKAMENI